MNAPLGRPFSVACERNREPILEVLRQVLPAHGRVLEIGSGSGQHAVHFAAALPGLEWQTSEREEGQLVGIRLWLDETRLPNTPAPRLIDIERADTWPTDRFDVVFTANTLHYMPADSVQRLFARLPAVMNVGAILVVYGPFNRDGQYTSESNARFDVWLKDIDPRFAIRDRDWVDQLAGAAGLNLLADHPMPANNRCLVWQRAGTP